MKTKVLLWLDDIRNPFIADWLLQYAPEFDEDRDNVVWVKNYDDFIDWIEKNGLPYKIAFDHDLGDDVARERVSNGMSKRQARIKKRETMSGFECTKWLIDYCIDNDTPLPKWVVQSANPVGADNINGLLNNYLKHYKS